MPFVIRPDGDTDLANAQIVAEGTLPQDITGLAAGDWQVGRVAWAPAPVTVTAPVSAPVTAPASLFRTIPNSTFTLSTLTMVSRIPAADVAGASALRLRIRGPVDGLYIGHQKGGSGDDRFNFAAPPVQVTFGGAGSVAAAASETTLSDVIPGFAPNGTDNLLIAAEIDAGKTYAFHQGAGAPLSAFFNLSNVEAASMGKSGYSASGSTLYIVEEVLDASTVGGTYPATIVADGNSIVNGVGADPGFGFVDFLADRTGATVVNLGANGATTAQRRSANDTGPAYVAGAAAVLFEITNDLYFGADAATAQANYQGWCNDVRAQGYTVYACTVLPRSEAGTPASFETDRQTVNTWLRSNYTSFADGLIDFAADPAMGDAGDETDTTYYSDLAHPSAAGHNRLANRARDVLDVT